MNRFKTERFADWAFLGVRPNPKLVRFGTTTMKPSESIRHITIEVDTDDGENDVKGNKGENCDKNLSKKRTMRCDDEERKVTNRESRKNSNRRRDGTPSEGSRNRKFDIDGGELEVDRIALNARLRSKPPEYSARVPCEGKNEKYMNKELADDFLSVVSRYSVALSFSSFC